MRDIDIRIRIQDTPLEARRCMRCGSEDFRAIAHTFRFAGTSDHGAVWHDDIDKLKNEQTSIPLAICLNCFRVVSLI